MHIITMLDFEVRLSITPGLLRDCCKSNFPPICPAILFRIGKLQKILCSVIS